MIFSFHFFTKKRSHTDQLFAPKIIKIKEELKINKNKIQSYKIECIFVKDETSCPVTLIGLDGLIKLEEENLNLNKIFKLISTMPMANF